MLRSIPMDTKKKLMNISFKGRIFPIAWWLYWDPEMTIPAKKAPRAKERPMLDVKTAADKHIKTTLTRNNCLLPVLPTQ